MNNIKIYMTKDGTFCKRCYPIIEKNQTQLNLNKENNNGN